jgi:hypothetical protein
MIVLEGKEYSAMIRYRNPWFVFAAAAFPLLTAPAPAACQSAPETQSPAEVYFTPYSHLDLFWGGTREECLARGNRIIAKAIRQAGQSGEFRFLLESEVFAQNYVETHKGSAELEQLKRLAREGRFEISPYWASIFQGLPAGEVHVRNLVIGKRCARTVFGVDPKVAHLGDVPDYAAQYPQLLASAGVPNLIMTRMGPSDRALFRWKAPDGSTTLVWNALKDYGQWVFLRREPGPADVDRVKKQIGEARVGWNGPLFVHWGVDLWSTPDNLLDVMHKLNEVQSVARFRFATPSDFFARVSAMPGIPTISGEIPSSWPNIATSLVHMWPQEEPATNALLTAEKFAAINYGLNFADYPGGRFEVLWKMLIESMDHNHDGQGGVIGDNRKIGYTQLARLESEEILRDMLRNIAERVQSPLAGMSHSIIVFNSQNWQRDDVVSAHVTVYGDVGANDIGDYRKGLKLVDEQGSAIPFHVEATSENISKGIWLTFTAPGVPALGYKTFYLLPAPVPGVFPPAAQAQLDSAKDRKEPRRPLANDILENQYYRVTVDRATGRVSLFDKDLDRDVASGMEMVGMEERGGNYIGIEPQTGRAIPNSIRRVELEENTPVRAVLRIAGFISDIPITQRLILYRFLKRLDIENTVEWKGPHLMRIQQLIPAAQKGVSIHYGVPFGASDTHNILTNAGTHLPDEIPNESWKHVRHVQDWFHAGGAEWGLTVAVDHPLITLDGDLVRAEMIRGTKFSSTRVERDGEVSSHQYPPAGTYVFRYSLSSQRGDWKAAKAYRAGMDFNNPLIAVAASDRISAKPLPPSRSFCSLDGESLVLTALKKADSGPGVVLRFFEMEGASGETSVRFLGRRASPRALNVLEEETSPPGGLSMAVGPNAIKTVKIDLPTEVK